MDTIVTSFSVFFLQPVSAMPSNAAIKRRFLIVILIFFFARQPQTSGLIIMINKIKKRGTVSLSALEAFDDLAIK